MKFMHDVYHKYTYDGPVLEFDRMVAIRWKGETVAPSAKKAKSNLAYQYKKQNNRLPNVKVTLPDDVKKIS